MPFRVKNLGKIGSTKYPNICKCNLCRKSQCWITLCKSPNRAIYDSLAFLYVLDGSSSDFCLLCEEHASISLRRKVNNLMDLSAPPESLIYIPRAKMCKSSEIHTVYKILSHGTNLGLQKDQASSVMYVRCRD